MIEYYFMVWLFVSGFMLGATTSPTDTYTWSDVTANTLIALLVGSVWPVVLLYGVYKSIKNKRLSQARKSKYEN